MFRHDGHLSDLGLELIHAGDGSEGAAHLATCALCQAREAALHADQAAFEALPPLRLPPPVAASAPTPPPAANRPMWLVVAVLAAAAAWLFVPTAQLPDPARPDAFRSKGPGIDLRLHVHDGEGSRLAEPGEAVHAGDRVGFSVQTRDAGHLIIAGIDAANAPYLCFPQLGPPEARPVDASRDFVAIEDAVQIDATPGSEHIVALLCDEPVAWATVEHALREAGGARPLPSLIDGCEQVERRLDKDLP